ncbi:hypothetical protein F66182_12024, partial [Fusarium sp. NRRL 66182]
MEHGAHRELLPGRRTDTFYEYTACYTYVLDHQDDTVTACCPYSGKTKVDASFGEILVTAEKLKWTIDHGEKALTPERRPTNFLMMYKKNSVRYEPLGVVSA